jgi:hypothetical protein
MKAYLTLSRAASTVQHHMHRARIFKRLWSPGINSKNEFRQPMYTVS